jgi:hypothetical protein
MPKLARSRRVLPKPSLPPSDRPDLARTRPARPASFAPPSTSENFKIDLPGKLEAFVRRWESFHGTEQAGAQEFLQKLLEIYEVSFKPGTLFEQHPVRVQLPPRQTSLFALDDEEEQGLQFTTERMDMYLPKVCVWEMKAPSEKQLEKHHDQILGYWARMRTRYMVLCNFHEFWIYDTDDDSGQGQLVPKLKFPLKELPSRGDAILFLRGEKPDLERSSERVTADIAKKLGRLVRELIAVSPNPDRDRERVAKFVLECVFAMFAEDTDLVPPRLFTNAMREARDSGKMDEVWSLFDDFATRESIRRVHRFAPYVNGPLFDPSNPKLALSLEQMHRLYDASTFDWQGVRPEIFGSIFEQALDVVERHELGAHFTREEDIERVVGPTVIEPWQQRIAAIRSPKDAERVVAQMKTYHVLDPACGCGNFLYVVYREMKRLETALVDKWISVHRAVAKRKVDIRPPPPRPYFSLDQVHGIEINGFAAFLARVVMWIGEHLAARELGLDDDTLPLKSLDDKIRQDDALIAEWHRPDGELAIVGNPPYLGVRKMRDEFGSEYVDQLFEKYPGNRAADYVTYWFAQALGVLRPNERAGFVCTNSVAQNESREASIDRIIAKGGALTDAWRSYPWPGESAVHISIVNWVMSPYAGVKTLDGHEATTITPSLTDSVDLTTTPALEANKGLCFMGITPGNAGFVLKNEERNAILAADPRSTDVIKPYLIGRDVNREVDQRPTRWIIDFGMMEEKDAARFAGAMRHVRKHVYPIRKDNRREAYARNWWRFVEPRPGLRKAIQPLAEALTITAVGPHLIVTRHHAEICFDHKLYVVAVASFYHLGILQSATHLRWVRARPSTLKGDLSYANTTNFETFPFPRSPDGTYNPRVVPKGEAAERLTTTAKEFDRIRSETCRKRSLGLTKIHNLLRDGTLPGLAQAYEAMNDAVDACYGFPIGVWRDEKATLRLLLQLSHELAEPVNSVHGRQK